MPTKSTMYSYLFSVDERAHDKGVQLLTMLLLTVVYVQYFI